MSLPPNTRPRPASNGVKRILSLATPYVILSMLLVAFVAVLIAPHFAHAANAVECKSASFCPLADVSKSLKLEKLYSSDTDLVGYINSLFKIAISLGAIIAVIRLSIGGYLYMGGEMWSTKEQAKNIFREVFLGLFLLLSIWLILNQINPQLLNLKIDFPGVPVAPAVAGPRPTAVSVRQDTLDAILKDENRVRNLLAGLGIDINRGGVVGGMRCLTIDQIECTNVGLLPNDAIYGLQKLKNGCQRASGNCPVMVNGGTEWFLHGKNTLHGPGNPVVDLAKNDTLDRYIKSASGGRGGKDSKNRRIYYLDMDGKQGRFLDEDYKHWHVTF